MKLSITLLLIFVSCILPAQNQVPNPSSDKIINENYPFNVTATSECYINKTGDYTFFSETDFIDFCNANFGLDSKIPFIDFNQETAVIIFNALKKSTAKLFVDNVVETEHYIKIYAKTSEPTKDAINNTLRNQYVIVKVKKSNKEIIVVRL
ncbi:MAG: hypothetical protein V4506_17700 [Bacteroidota bacterium]